MNGRGQKKPYTLGTYDSMIFFTTDQSLGWCQGRRWLGFPLWLQTRENNKSPFLRTPPKKRQNTRWFKPCPFHPRSLEVTFSPLWKGSRELTIPKRSRLESPKNRFPSPLFLDGRLDLRFIDQWLLLCHRVWYLQHRLQGVPLSVRFGAGKNSRIQKKLRRKDVLLEVRIKG